MIESLLADPDRETSPFFERGVILALVADSADFFMAEELYHLRLIRNYTSPHFSLVYRKRLLFMR